MAALTYPLVNGVRYDHSSLDIKIAGLSFLGVKSIDYSDGLEPGKGYGTSGQKLFRTRGIYDPSASIELWTAEAYNFEALLIQQNPNTGLYECAFNIDVNRLPEGGVAMATDNIVGCRIKKVSESSSQGSADAHARKYELDVMYIKRNGNVPLTNMRL